jgi:hypothetical protein
MTLWLEPVRRLVVRVGLPVVPLAMGIVFFLNYGIHKALGATQKDTPHIHWPNVEVKETLFAFLFLVISIYFLRDAIADPARPDRSTQGREPDRAGD